MKLKRVFYNIFLGFGTQLAMLAVGLIVPRLILKSYGSEVNGLFSTVANIYTYLALVEAGIGASALQDLYKPAADNNHQEINEILGAARRHFRRCAVLYLIGTAVLTLLLPWILKTEIGKWEIAAVVALQGAASLANFYVLAGITTLLPAEGKEYVQNSFTFFTAFAASIAKIILVNFAVNIVVLQLAYFFITILSIAAYYAYFKWNYPWIDFSCRGENRSLKQRRSFFVHSVVYIIFNNTDVILLSAFCGLKVSSVYAVYNMIFLYLLKLINSVFNGVKFTLGQTYHRSRKKYLILHDAYKSCYCAFVFALMSVCYVLITPFIRLYTAGVTDIDYVDPYLPLLFCVLNLLSVCRSTESNLISLSFHARQTLSRTIAEAVINLSASLVLVQKLGIYGCLLGTVLALLYRTNDMIIYANRRILSRNPVQAYKTVAVNFVLFFSIVWLSDRLNLRIGSYGGFAAWGMLLCPIFMAIFFICNAAVNAEGFRYVRRVLCTRLSQRTALKKG